MNTLKTAIAFVLLITLSTSIHAQASKEKWAKIITQKEPSWYATREAYEIAENVLLYQRDNGGWPKNIEMQEPLTDEEKEKLIALKSSPKGTTTDNFATTQEMLYLSKMYVHIHDQRYVKAYEAAFNYLLEAQYDNGGWPQFYPLKKGYYTHITYNDDSMVNIMKVLKSNIDDDGVYSIKLSDASIDKAKIAFDKGIDCILKTQYKQNGVLTAWCQQHDETTLLPTSARAYELPALTGKESSKIVLLLMSIKHPSPQVITAVNSAYAWFEKTKITSLKEVRVPIPNSNKLEKVMVEDPENALPLWGRFMELDDNRVFFCDRDGIKKYDIADIGQERRIGYSWYTNQPKEVLKKYPKWSKKYNK